MQIKFLFSLQKFTKLITMANCFIKMGYIAFIVTLCTKMVAQNVPERVFLKPQVLQNPIQTELNFAKNAYKVQTDCDTIEGLTGTFDEKNKAVNLEWIAPLIQRGNIHSTENEKDANNNFTNKANGWIGWSGTPQWILSTSCSCDIIFTARFTPQDLAAFGVETNNEITKVRFRPSHSNESEITIQIYQGGQPPIIDEDGDYVFPNPGILMYQQEITDTLIDRVYNEIVLNTPFKIDISQELWVGVRINSLSGFYLVADSGPSVPGKGNVISIVEDDEYYWYANMFWAEYNWNIDFSVGETYFKDYSYNVYRNDDLIASNLKETHYTDSVAAISSGNYEYCIKAVNLDCTSESVCQNVLIQPVSIDEYSTKETSTIYFYPNPASNFVTFDGENIANIRVYNSVGQFMANHINGNTIDVSSYKAGLYFFETTSAEGKIERFKVVIR